MRRRKRRSGGLLVSTVDAVVVVRIDDEYKAGLSPDEVQAIVGWGITIAGESYNGSGQTNGPVFTGQDGGYRSQHVGTWAVY